MPVDYRNFAIWTVYSVKSVARSSTQQFTAPHSNQSMDCATTRTHSGKFNWCGEGGHAAFPILGFRFRSISRGMVFMRAGARRAYSAPHLAHPITFALHVKWFP